MTAESEPDALVLSGHDRAELVRRLLDLRELGRDLAETFGAAAGGDSAAHGAAAVVESVDRMLELLRADELDEPGVS